MVQHQKVQGDLKEHIVIDADVHLQISLHQVTEYLHEPYRRMAEHGVRPSDAWDRYKSGRIERRDHFDSAETIREDLCEGFGVDHPIIHPSLSTSQSNLTKLT